MPCWGPDRRFEGRHVLITGGSEGIGLSLAKVFAGVGANVTILARTQAKLEAAKSRLELVQPKHKTASRPTIHIVSADVTDNAQVQAAVQDAKEAQGPVDVLVCNAGAAHFGYFQDLDLAACNRQMQLNYFGAVHAIKAVYNDMLQRGSGHICIVSSTLGTLAFTGCGAYSPAKYALKGLADTLRNEVQGTGVKVHVSLPPDTKTPGYELENTNKPPETREFSEGSSLFTADQVAAGIYRGIRDNIYMVPNPDMLLTLHTRAVAGLTPRRFPGVLLDMLAGLVTPLVYWVWTAVMDRSAAKQASKRTSSIHTGVQHAPK